MPSPWFFSFLPCALLLALPLGVRAQPADSATATELNALVAKITEQLQAGKRTPAELGPELTAFDDLLAKHRTTKSDDVARILYMKATLYGQVFQDLATAKELFARVESEFPGTERARYATETLAKLNRMLQAREAQAGLVGQPAPELNFSWSSRKGLKTLSSLKGKVVVLDFWATWCGPCIASFPQVRELTAHYAKADVEVIGVTSLQGQVVGPNSDRIDTQGNPTKEYALMSDYIKAKDVTWTIAFSDEPVFNPAYGITGIPHMAIVAPDGTVRHTGLHPAMPHEEKVRMIDALLQEFGKPLAASPKLKSKSALQ